MLDSVVEPVLCVLIKTNLSILLLPCFRSRSLCSRSTPQIVDAVFVCIQLEASCLQESFFLFLVAVVSSSLLLAIGVFYLQLELSLLTVRVFLLTVGSASNKHLNGV